MNYIVGSVTSYIGIVDDEYFGKLPIFDIMYVDPDTLLPIDLEMSSFDL